MLKIANRWLMRGCWSPNDQGRRSYDRFRERVMFPIRDKRGRVIGFGGRVLGDAPPKYLNSRKPIFSIKVASCMVFGEAQQDNADPQRPLVVEGYGCGGAGAMALTTPWHPWGRQPPPIYIQLLFRATNNVICCYDGDRAGRDVAWRALETAPPYMTDDASYALCFTRRRRS